MLVRLKCSSLKQQTWNFGQRILFQNSYQSKSLPNSTRLLSNKSVESTSSSSDNYFHDATLHSGRRNWIKPIVISSIAFFAGFLTYRYMSKDEVESVMDSIKYLFHPVVNAAIPTGNSDISNRKKFNFFADIVERASPAVVYIEIKDKRHVDYFSREPVTASNGSGFIFDHNGLILTNAHVVINKPHTFVQVRLQDGRKFLGYVENVDPVSDLATVRIDCKNLPTMKLGSSADLRAGEWVVVCALQSKKVDL